MTIIKPSSPTANHQISKIETTSDCLADRGGLALLMRYTDHSGLVGEIADQLNTYRTGAKGIPVTDLIRQTLGFFFDGTSRRLTFFDHLKQNPGYHAVMETPAKRMVSSHQVKRFFSKLHNVSSTKFRATFRKMFAARLSKEQPKVVELFLDTMVLDNDDAICRQGVQPTYKKVKGFQPLQLIWNGQVVDAQFRGGKKNGNHGWTALNMIYRAVKVIRKQLGYEVAIMVRMDAGFFDGKLFEHLSAINVGFLASSRLTEGIKAAAKQQTQWTKFDNGSQTWAYFELGSRCHSWEKFYRTIYLKPHYEENQMLLDFARPEQAIITNMGSCSYLFNNVPTEIREKLYDPEELIAQHHRKGADELTHRGIKDLGFEQLPFKKFAANMAFYYLMVIAYNLMECYKHDVLQGIVGSGSYATTVRRVAIDFAAKFVRTGRKLIMKVTKATMDRLNLERLWQRCNQMTPALV